MRDDPKLLSAFRAGEPEALREVYVRHVDKVDALVKHGFVTQGPPPFRVPGMSHEGRRDVVQEVFLRAFRDSARLAYDGLRPYLPYLVRITKNVCIDRYRRAKHERLHSPVELLDMDAALVEVAELPMPPDEDSDFRVLSAHTRAFVGGLDAEARQFVQLRFEQELSQLQVAARMGVTRRRVRTLEEQVLTGLRKHLARQEVRR